MKQPKGWISRIRWQVAFFLFAGIVLIPSIRSTRSAALPTSTSTFTRLHQFALPAEPQDGTHPYGPLIEDSSGNLYGTTLSGGGSTGCGLGGCGMVFTLTSPARNERILHIFTGGTDGAVPAGGLIQDAAGNLYGTTAYGGGASACSFGCGTVFKVTTLGTETVLYSFAGGAADGAYPEASLIMDLAGNLYGTTFGGGSSACPGGCGVVFKLSPTGTETVLYSFTGDTDGANPIAGLIRDAAGNFYGTTLLRGTPGCTYSYGCGTVFELSPAGSLRVLHSFSGGADGGNPQGGVILDASGNLYGTTAGGGASTCSGGCGVVFKLSPAGTETVLYSFTGATDGANPNSGLIEDAAGTFYGTTFNGNSLAACRAGCGTVFELSSAGTETALYDFNGGANGANPNASLIQDAAGNLYGTASAAGIYAECPTGCGTVFKLTP